MSRKSIVEDCMKLLLLGILYSAANLPAKPQQTAEGFPSSFVLVARVFHCRKLLNDICLRENGKKCKQFAKKTSRERKKEGTLKCMRRFRVPC
jgi:hypothetical protein